MTTDELADIPTIDVRPIPPYERHPRICSVLEALRLSQSSTIVSDHEPRRLPLPRCLVPAFAGAD